VLPVYDTTALHAQAAVEWIITEPAPKAEAKVEVQESEHA
jgi:hypothetical protein